MAKLLGEYMIIGQIEGKVQLAGSSGCFSTNCSHVCILFSNLIFMSYKVYFLIKTDWVSCCYWDFLASHHAFRQNCSNSLILYEIISCSDPAMLQLWFSYCSGTSVCVHVTYFDYGTTKSLLLLNLCKMVWVSLHTAYATEVLFLFPSSKGKSNWFLLFSGRVKTLLLLLDFHLFQRNERANLLYFSSWSLEYPPECKEYQMQTHLHLRVCCSCF